MDRLGIGRAVWRPNMDDDLLTRLYELARLLRVAKRDDLAEQVDDLIVADELKLAAACPQWNHDPI